VEDAIVEDAIMELVIVEDVTVVDVTVSKRLRGFKVNRLHTEMRQQREGSEDT
jgi:hypothetical protein